MPESFQPRSVLKDEVAAVISQHGAQLGIGEIPAMLSTYAFPLVILDHGASHTLTGPERLGPFLEDIHRRFRDMGAVEVCTEVQDVVMLSGPAALATTRSTVRDAARHEVTGYATSYVMELMDGDWRIRVVAVDQSIDPPGTPCPLMQQAA